MTSRNDATIPYPKQGGAQSVAYTGTAGTIAAGVTERMVLVFATSAAHVSFDGTATTADPAIPANTPLYFRIRPGQRPSAIQITSGGTLYVSEMTY